MSFIKKYRNDQQHTDQAIHSIPNNTRDGTSVPLKPLVEDKPMTTADIQPSSLQSFPKNKRSNYSYNNNSITNSSTKKRGGRRVLNRFESAPQEGWKLIKKWVGANRQQSKLKQQQQIINFERQAEVNKITPLIMAMYFAKDEDGGKRVPVFLHSISVKVTKLDENDDDYFSLKKKKKYRGTIFKITVQYGTGPGKITWCVYRRYWDFVRLHYQYKNRLNTNNNGGTNTLGNRRAHRMPNFPSLPRHHFRKQKRKDYERRNPMSRLNTGTSSGRNTPHSTNSVMDEEALMAMVTMHSQEEGSTSNHHQQNHNKKTSRSNIPTVTQGDGTESIASSQVMEVVKADKTVLQALENYLNQFITSVGPCGYINRLCRFLEISALGLQLAAKYPVTGCHGKEGFAVFQSRTDRDPKQTRKFLQDGLVFSFPTTGGRRRRKPKWFIVRESYVLCLDNPSEVNIYTFYTPFFFLLKKTFSLKV